MGSQTSVLEFMHFGDERFDSVPNMKEGEVRFERAKSAADLVFKNRHTCEQSFARYDTRLTSMPDLKDILKTNTKEHANTHTLLLLLAQHCKVETEDPSLILPESLRDVKDSAKRDMHILEAIELCDILHSDEEEGVDALVEAIKIRTRRQLESYMKEKERRVEKMLELLDKPYLTTSMKRMFETAKEVKPDILASTILHFATKPIFSSEDLERDDGWGLGSYQDAMHEKMFDEYKARVKKRAERESSSNPDAHFLSPPDLDVSEVSEVSSSADELVSYSLLREELEGIITIVITWSR